MSFILDALKKSENERQRQVGPSLADVQVRRRSSDKPWWVIAVGALLVVNLGVLLVVLTREKSPETSAPQTTTPQPQNAQRVDTQRPLPASESRMPRGNPAAVAQSPAVRSLADEAGQEANAYGAGDPAIVGPAAAASIPEGPPLVRPIDAPAVEPAGAQPVFEARTTERQESLPTASDLAANGTNLPEMHLDIHVYSRNPADRFVFVNMRKYTEGQSLNEGPSLERITTEGVILNHRGQRFLLPRQ